MSETNATGESTSKKKPARAVKSAKPLVPVKRARGYAAIKERTDKEMMRFIPDPEEEAMIQHVAMEVILKGRPPKYLESEVPAEDMPTRIFNLITDVSYGMRTIDGCAALLGIVDDTFRVWQRDHERFSAAVKMGKKVQEMKASKRMSQGVMYPTSLIFTMKNLHKWADRIETTTTFDLKTTVERFQAAAKPVDWDKGIIDVVTVQGTATLLESAGDTM